MDTPIVVDTHQHFWFDPTKEEYPWMTGDYSPIRRTFGPDELRPLLADAGIDFTVLVQTRSSLAETEMFLDLAVNTDFVAGVVGWVDLTDPNIAARLRDLRGRKGGKYLVAIRHQVHDEPDPRWLLRDDVQRGLGSVEEAHLAFDFLVRPRELPAALETARRFPRLHFVIDHIAKPPIASGQMDGWAENMARISDLANVSCKISGMVTEADWRTWSVGDLLPYVSRVMGWFGPERLMIGSDWPVCLLAAPYQETVTAYHDAVSRVDPNDREDIFGRSAIRSYRLPIAASS